MAYFDPTVCNIFGTAAEEPAVVYYSLLYGILQQFGTLCPTFCLARVFSGPERLFWPNHLGFGIGIRGTA